MQNLRGGQETENTFGVTQSKNFRRISGTPRPSLLHCKNMMQAGVDY